MGCPFPAQPHLATSGSPHDLMSTMPALQESYETELFPRPAGVLTQRQPCTSLIFYSIHPGDTGSTACCPSRSAPDAPAHSA